MAMWMVLKTASNGNIRTSGSRNYSPLANYGFVSNGDINSGDGLPHLLLVYTHTELIQPINVL